MRKDRSVGIILAFSATTFLFGCADANRNAHNTSELPVSKVVMYQSGVGYVERQGKVEGDELVLRIKSNQINDILKSLTVIDRGKGRPVSISLPVSRNALDSLQDIPEQISQGGGILALLHAFRGAHVLVKAKGKTVNGRVVGVEYNEGMISSKGEIPVSASEWVVTLMSDGERLEVLKLKDISSVELYDKSLSVGLDKSLDVSLGAGDWKPIELRIRMSSKAKRDIAMSYIVAMPTWKPAYRLILNENDTGTLQGWAVISNVSGSEWENIAFSLVSGQPMSFTYDLYSPLFVQRPDLSGQARTRAIAPKPQAAANESEPWLGGGGGAATGYAAAKASPSAKREKGYYPEEESVHEAIAYDLAAADDMEQEFAPAPSITAEEYQSNFEALTSAQQVGSFFEYKLESALSVPDGASALVNLLQQNVPSVEARLFDSLASQQTTSYQTVQLNNNASVALEAGPITIYKGSAFIGEGYMTRTEPGQTAQITFAADDRLSLSMTQEPYSSPTNVALDRIENGYVHVTGSIGETINYTLNNRANMALTALVKRPVRSGWTPTNHPENTLTNNGYYYIPVSVEANSEKKFNIQSSSKNSASYSLLTPVGAQALKDALPNSEISADLRKSVTTFLEQYERMAPIDDQIGQISIRKKELEADSAQISSSLKDLKDLKTASAQSLMEQLIKRQRTNETELATISTKLAELRVQRSEIEITLRALIREMRYNKA